MSHCQPQALPQTLSNSRMFFTPETETHYANLQPKILWAFCALTAGTYFLVSVAGSMDLFSKDEPVPPAVYALSVLSGIVIGMTVYEAFKTPLLKPTQGYQRTISVFAKIAGGASLSFYTGGAYGAKLMGLPYPAEIALATGSLATRFYICHRSAYLMCNILPKVSEALKSREALNLISFLLCFSLGAAVNLFQTDPTLAAIQDITKNQLTGELSPIAYGLMGLFCTAGIPGSSIFAYFGLKKLMDPPKAETISEKIIEKTPSILAGLFCIGLFTLPALGALTNAESGDGLTAWTNSPSNLAKVKIALTIPFTLLSTLTGGERFIRKIYSGLKSTTCFQSRSSKSPPPIEIIIDAATTTNEAT